VNGQRIGSIETRTLEGFAVQASEIYLDSLYRIERARLSYEPIVTFPSVERDASLLLDETVPYSRLKEVLQNLRIPELRSFRLIDRYRGKNIPPHKVGLTLRLTFQSSARTLTSEEVDLLWC